MTANGLRIGDGREFEKRQPSIAQKPNSSTNVEFTTVSPQLPIRCCVFMSFMESAKILPDYLFCSL